ncbi:MAG: M14 family zinc carboxypeptidase, partial [Candidatus Hodarchaeales archaeon]
ASDDPSSQGYHGPAAFSENCTARFRDFVLQRNFVAAVSLHSGVELVGGPWSYLGTHVSGRDLDMYLSTGMKLQELTDLPFVTEFYSASGEWGDWMYGRPNGTLLEFTFETYGNFSTIFSVYNATTGYYHDRGVWDAFNPPADKVIDNCAQIYPGLLFIAVEAPYLSIQTVNQKVKDNIHIKVTVTNPSSSIRTNGSIALDFMVSQVKGLTLLNSTTTVNFGELEAQSSQQTVFIFSIDQSNYSAHLFIRVNGPKVGVAIVERDLDPSTITFIAPSTPLTTLIATSTTPAFSRLIIFIGLLAFAVHTIIRRNEHR